MVSIIGEEYVSFTESTKGQFSPLTAVLKYDGTLLYREMTREDVFRIDEISNSSLPNSGWLYRKTLHNSSSWLKRFAILRGDYLFLFHSPKNDKPIAVVPMHDCKIIAPENNEKSFDEIRSYRANDGFEFEISHSNRPTVRLYAPTARERAEWLVVLQKAASNPIHPLSTSSQHNSSNLNPNIIVSATRLVGPSMTSTIINSPHSPYRNAGRENFVYPYMPTTINQSASPSPHYATNHNSHDFDSQSFNVANSQHSSSTGFSLPNSSFNYHMISPPTQILAPTNLSPISMNPNKVSMHAPPPISPYNFPDEESYHSAAPYGVPDTSPYSNKFPHASSPIKPMTHDHAYEQSNHIAIPVQTHLKINRTGSSTTRKGSLQSMEVNFLEKNLQNKLSEQSEARSREANIRSKISSKQSIIEARIREEVSPLSLAELFRATLFLFDEELVEDPQPGSNLRIPHLKGSTTETMLTMIYQHYCGESGYISLEQFVEFVEDLAVLQTHVPHDENDEPIPEYRTLLDPVRLLTLVPRNYGFATSTIYSSLNQHLVQAAKQDKFIINFSQFYQLILIITQIVYADLFETDPTLAANKFLQECVCPLFVWSKDHHKRGSIDVVVIEERILLLMTMYAPNLWKVFLTYATDAVGKVGDTNQPFPESAQVNEKGLFKLPPAAPSRHFEEKSTVDSLIMTESSCLRFAADYAITPHVVTVKELRDIHRRSNRSKVIVASKLPMRDTLHTKTTAAAQQQKTNRNKEVLPATPVSKSQRTDGRTVKGEALPPPPPLLPGSHATIAAKGGDESKPNPNNIGKEVTGLGFSEFIELIARVAVEGMEQENYHILFPTPFSKVLAILTIWGVADMKRLAEVHIIHTEEIY